MEKQNYNEMSTKSKKQETKNEEVIKNPVAKPTLIGFVSDCERLNIRVKPNIDSDVLTIVDKNTKLEIVHNEPLCKNNFYSVIVHCPNSVTITGYAMADYITIG